MSDPFVSLPPGWRRTRLDHVASVNARIGWKALTAAEYQPEGVAFLSTPNIKGKEIDFAEVNFITEFRYEESPELKLQEGDVLLVKDGNTLGITNVVRSLPRPATVNGSIAVLRPTGIEPRFLRYALASDATQGRINAVKDGMGVPHLFQADIKKFPLPEPPLDRQLAIADYLDTETARIDALIAKKQQMQKVLRQRIVAAIDAATAGAGDLVQVRHLAYRLTSGPRGWADFVADHGTPFIRITNIQRLTIELNMAEILLVDPPRGAESRRTEVRDGDVLVSITADIGSVGVARAGQVGANVSQHVALVSPKLDIIEPDWLAFAIRSTHARGQLESGQYGGTKTQLSLGDVASLRVPLPSLDEQRGRLARLRRTLRETYLAADLLGVQVGLLGEHRQALITAAVTGELAVPGVAA